MADWLKERDKHFEQALAAKLVSDRTVDKIAQDPVTFARLLLMRIGTDATEAFLNQMWDVFNEDGSHK